MFDKEIEEKKNKKKKEHLVIKEHMIEIIKGKITQISKLK